ncbi:hypothetical protein CK934_26575 [Chitinophaga sp. MD30]|nr:hypothetical protein CK934_26575 [Chitinophaga sp. MD30]
MLPRKSKHSYGLLPLLFLLTAGMQVAVAQSSSSSSSESSGFSWEAPVPAPVQPGFYRIAIGPAISAVAAKVTLQDLRLLRDGQQQPYILQQEGFYDTTRFQALEIMERQRTPAQLTTVTFRGPEAGQEGHTLLDQLVLQVKNTGVRKLLRVSGSNDGHEWYAISGWLLFDPESMNGTEGDQQVSFRLPATDYTWYQLQVNDSASAPLYIEKIGRFLISTRPADYIPNPTPKLTKITAQNAQESIFRIDADAAYVIDKISIDISAPTLYRRPVVVAVAAEDKSHSKSGPAYHPIAHFTLRPGQTSIQLPSPVKQQQLYLLVTDGDSPPLQIGRVHTFQQITYLVAYLEKGGTYQLKGGDAHLAAPVYDLTYFTDSLPAQLPVLLPGMIVQINGKEAAATPTVFQSKIWIWIGLILVIGLLAVISLRMLREMKQRGPGN